MSSKASRVVQRTLRFAARTIELPVYCSDPIPAETALRQFPFENKRSNSLHGRFESHQRPRNLTSRPNSGYVPEQRAGHINGYPGQAAAPIEVDAT